MGFKKALDKYFPGAMPERAFVEKTLDVLSGKGFSADNTIACVGVCRDEITQPFVEFVKQAWGEAFNFSSLAGMLFLGKTGFTAAQHHAPDVDGKERYVGFTMPHIAISSEGEIGICLRRGRKGPSSACGALAAFQAEMADGRVKIGIDFEDVEQSLIRIRLLQEIHYGQVPDLLALTKTALKVIQKDLKRLIELTVDTGRSDYAVFTGIQIHGPNGNFIWPELSYCVVNGEQQSLKL
jgi:hypothetical protein